MIPHLREAIYHSHKGNTNPLQFFGAEWPAVIFTAAKACVFFRRLIALSRIAIFAAGGCFRSHATFTAFASFDSHCSFPRSGQFDGESAHRPAALYQATFVFVPRLSACREDLHRKRVPGSSAEISFFEGYSESSDLVADLLVSSNSCWISRSIYLYRSRKNRGSLQNTKRPVLLYVK